MKNEDNRRLIQYEMIRKLNYLRLSSDVAKKYTNLCKYYF